MDHGTSSAAPVNKPSDSLFVADLPSGLTEDEFAGLFVGQEGYVSSRLREDRNRNIVGFVEFTDVECTRRAYELFQGHQLAGHQLVIQYARPSRRRMAGGVNRQGASNGRGGDRLMRDQHAVAASSSPYARGEVPPTAYPQQPYYTAGPQAHYGFAPGASMTPAYNIMLPEQASSSLYLEGIPHDAHEREMAHIFRPFPGYQSLRLVHREGGRRGSHNLCFVEFDNKYQATAAMDALQGYRMDLKSDRSPLLRIQYARSQRTPPEPRLVPQEYHHDMSHTVAAPPMGHEDPSGYH